MLTQLDHLPDGILDCPATELHRYLEGPTLVHLEGRRSQPLFVSILLHGNETTGLFAIQDLLKQYTQQTLPRSLSIFFGNISAAREGLRRLDDQPDYNRIWPGSSHQDCPETQMMQEVVEIMAARSVFASIDIHNNTGLNPHYACINRLDQTFIQLATLFSRTVVYFIRPKGVQALAFADICPAVILECGKPDQAFGAQHAHSFLNACLHLSEIPQHAVAEHDVDLFHTVAQVKIPDDTSFSFSDPAVDILFDDDLDRYNFQELPAGSSWGVAKDKHNPDLVTKDEHGLDATDQYFCIEKGRLTLKKTIMPSMLTLDEHVIRQDCLCYLMERMGLDKIDAKHYRASSNK